MRCDQCKHWKPEPEDWEAAAVGFGRCLAVRPRWEIQDEASGKMLPDTDDAEREFVRVRREALDGAQAYVQDGSQYVAELVTGPSFFCKLFAAAA